MSKLKNFLKRYEKAKSRAINFESIYDEAYKWFMPSRNRYNNQSEGTKNREHIYDNTAEDALSVGASRMQTMTVPSNQKWVNFKLTEEVIESLNFENPDEASELQNILDKRTKKFFRILDNSNFKITVNEAMHDYFIGTGTILVNRTDDPKNPIAFTSINPANLAIEEDDSTGIIKTNFRETKVMNINIMTQYPNASLPDKLLESINKKPTDISDFIEGVLYNNKNKNYEYMVVWDKKHIIKSEIFDYNPFVTFRASKLAGETFGRGQALQAVDDVKVLNAGTKAQMIAAEKSVSDITLATEDNVLNPEKGLDLSEDKLIIVQDVNGIKKLPFDLRNSPLNNEFLDQKRFAVRQKLNADKTERSDRITRSPEEIQAIQAERSFDLNAQFSRLDVEFLRPLIFALWTIMEEDNMFGDDLKLDITNSELFELSYQSPLAKLRETLEAQKLSRAISTHVQLFGVESLNEHMDVSGMATEILKLTDIPSKFIRTDKEKKQIREEKAKQQQALLEQQAQQQQ